MELSGTAHGKLLLFGDHAVVYGHAALGLTLPLRTQIVLTSVDTAFASPTPEQQTVQHLMPHFGEQVQQQWQEHHWNVTIESDVPIGRGFGSSAALTAALARALLPKDTSPDILWQQAHQAEHAFHGKPSGVDTALALGTGLSAYTRRPDHSPKLQTVSAAPFALVTGALPRSRDTGALIADVHTRIRQDSQANASLAALGKLSVEAIEGLPSTPAPTAQFLGQLASRAQGHLRQLGLSTPTLDHLLEIAMNHGATGGKLSGAGGGGAFVVFCADDVTATQVKSAIQRTIKQDVLTYLMQYRWDGGHLIDLNETQD